MISIIIIIRKLLRPKKKFGKSDRCAVTVAERKEIIKRRKRK